MKQSAGWWLPDTEQYMAQLLEGTAQRIGGRATYQHAKLEKALSYVTDWGLAIDVGAHVGTWAWFLARRFRVVLALEPAQENFDCLVANCAAEQNIRPRRCALGAQDGWVRLATKPGSSADTAVAGEVLESPEAGAVCLWTLDGAGDVGSPGLVKLDCIGYELRALQGMERILTESHPVVVVEQKPGYAARFGLPETGAVDYLQSLGATLRANMSGVYVLSW